MLIDKSTLGRLIPHAGTMCLLDSVRFWDEARIECLTGTHRDNGNPLRHNGRLGVLCGVEYASQAMALHAALTGGGNKPGRGFLASLRALVCHKDRLDLLSKDLEVEAVRLHGDSGQAIYSFVLRHDQCVLMEGRAAVIVRP